MALTKPIPGDEVQFNKTSYVDPNSRVFHWKDGIYRAVLPHVSAFYNGITGEEWFLRLQRERKIVETHSTGYSLDGYGLILEHEKVSPITYCMEWPALLLKKAGILTLELCLELLERDLTLQDAYPWNIQFKGTKPIFIDTGSIVPFVDDYLWTPYQQFCNFFLFPLYLYSEGLGEPARALMFNYLGGISFETCSKLLPFTSRLKRPDIISRLDLPLMVSELTRYFETPSAVESLKKSVKNINTRSARRKLFRGLLRDLKSIRLPEKKTVWSEYGQGDSSLEKSPLWTAKQTAVEKILEKIKPKSVLDVACNRGWFSLLSAKMGAGVISFDTDEQGVHQLSVSTDSKGFPVTPLIMNILNPTPAFGWNLQQFPPAPDRLKSDFTMALALIHHLVISQWQTFDRVVEALSAFTGRHLLLEFVPADDEKASILISRQKNRFQDYNLDNLVKAMEKTFENIEFFDSHPPGRILVLGRKKS